MLAISALKDFELLPAKAFPSPNLPAPGPPAPLDTEALTARANAAVAKLKEKAAKRNPSVTKEAQEIFDAIGRQLPTRWEGKDIVVMDQVIVRGPGYRSEDCRAGKDVAQGTLARVRKVVGHFSSRLSSDFGANRILISSKTSANASLNVTRQRHPKAQSQLYQLFQLYPHSVADRGKVVDGSPGPLKI